MLFRTTRSRGTLFNQQRHTSVASRIEPPISQCRFPSRITAAITARFFLPPHMYTRKGGGISFADHPCSFIKLKLYRPCTTWQRGLPSRKKIYSVRKPFSRRTNFSSLPTSFSSLVPSPSSVRRTRATNSGHVSFSYLLHLFRLAASSKSLRIPLIEWENGATQPPLSCSLCLSAGNKVSNIPSWSISKKTRLEEKFLPFSIFPVRSMPFFL